MNVFSVNGRLGRTRYFLTTFLCCIISDSAVFISSNNADATVVFACWSVVLACLWVSICVGAKRCHDLGHEGWWQLIPFYCLWMLFAKGYREDNEYGSVES